jgi:hypothetical protein
LLHLLGSAGLRRAEAADLLMSDVDERRRFTDPRLRAAIARSTRWWGTVRYGKRGRTRGAAAFPPLCAYTATPGSRDR